MAYTGVVVMRIKAFLTGLSTAWKIVTGLVLVIVLFLLINFIDDLLFGASEKKAEIRENQAEAAIDSGSDAVETIGNVNAGEDKTDKDVKDIQDEVNNANNVGDAHNAGASGLCDKFSICSEDGLHDTNSK